MELRYEGLQAIDLTFQQVSLRLGRGGGAVGLQFATPCSLALVLQLALEPNDLALMAAKQGGAPRDVFVSFHSWCRDLMQEFLTQPALLQELFGALRELHGAPASTACLLGQVLVRRVRGARAFTNAALLLSGRVALAYHLRVPGLPMLLLQGLFYKAQLAGSELTEGGSREAPVLSVPTETCPTGTARAPTLLEIPSAPLFTSFAWNPCSHNIRA